MHRLRIVFAAYLGVKLCTASLVYWHDEDEGEDAHTYRNTESEELTVAYSCCCTYMVIVIGSCAGK
jgi:hypothetical protein